MHLSSRSYLRIYPHFGETHQERRHHGTQGTGNPRENGGKRNIQSGGDDGKS